MTSSRLPRAMWTLIEPIHAVYLGKVERLPARVRAVLDFLVEHVETCRQILKARRLYAFLQAPGK